MGCFQAREKTLNISGHYNKDLREPRNTIQKFPYEKVLSSIPFREDIVELAKMEIHIFDKNSQSTSSEKTKYSKFRTKIQLEMNKINNKLGNSEEFFYADTRSVKVEQLKPFDFIDPYFPPTQQSLFDSRMGRHALAEIWEGFVWKRPIDVYGEGNFELFRGINPDDIKQGY